LRIVIAKTFVFKKNPTFYNNVLHNFIAEKNIIKTKLYKKSKRIFQRLMSKATQLGGERDFFSVKDFFLATPRFYKVRQSIKKEQ
jgi:hypothetical protein